MEAGMWARVISGMVLCVVGAVWIGQGVGSVHGSFMTGETQWAYIGGVAVLIGLFLLVGATRARRKRIDTEP
jgi:uncharacterized integral membrane protein